MAFTLPQSFLPATATEAADTLASARAATAQTGARSTTTRTDVFKSMMAQHKAEQTTTPKPAAPKSASKTPVAETNPHTAAKPVETKPVARADGPKPEYKTPDDVPDDASTQSADTTQTTDTQATPADTTTATPDDALLASLLGTTPGAAATATTDTATATADAPATDATVNPKDVLANLFDRAVKGVTPGQTGGQSGGQDNGQPDPQAQPQADTAKLDAVRATQLLAAFQARTPPARDGMSAKDASTASDVSALQSTVPDTPAPAFTLQPIVETQATYTAAPATGTVNASNLSQAAVQNLSAMSVSISRKLSEGNTKFSLELHPADLGRVDVALNIDRDGKTSAHLTFDTPVTASAFSAHESELRRQLNATGLSLDSGALSFSSRDDSNSGFSLDSGNQQQQSSAFAQDQRGDARQAARQMAAADQAADTPDLGDLDSAQSLERAMAAIGRNPLSAQGDMRLALNLVV